MLKTMLAATAIALAALVAPSTFTSSAEAAWQTGSKCQSPQQNEYCKRKFDAMKAVGRTPKWGQPKQGKSGKHR